MGNTGRKREGSVHEFRSGQPPPPTQNLFRDYFEICIGFSKENAKEV